MLSKLSIIITVKNRIEILETLKVMNTTFVRECPKEILVVSLDESEEYLRNKINQLNSIQKVIKLIHIPLEKFNKSLAINLGCHHSTGDIILQLDADILIDVANLKKMLEVLSKNSFVLLKEIKESADEAIEGSINEFKFALGIKYKDKVINVDTSKYYFNSGTKSAPGIILAWKEDIIKIDGYNSELEDYGFEDIDVIIRLQLAGLNKLETGVARHLTPIHDESRRKSDGSNLWECIDNYHNDILDGTMSEDNLTHGPNVKQFSF